MCPSKTPREPACILLLNFPSVPAPSWPHPHPLSPHPAEAHPTSFYLKVSTHPHPLPPSLPILGTHIHLSTSQGQRAPLPLLPRRAPPTPGSDHLHPQPALSFQTVHPSGLLGSEGPGQNPASLATPSTGPFLAPLLPSEVPVQGLPWPLFSCSLLGRQITPPSQPAPLLCP